MIVLVSVELVNLAILLTNETVMDTIMNFLALVIISDFDDYFFFTVKNEPLSKLITDGEFTFYPDEARTLDDITLIETTTSQDARFCRNRIDSDNSEYQRDNARDLTTANDGITVQAVAEQDCSFITKKPEYIYIDRKDRPWGNWLARMLYHFLKTVHTSVWFYFLPFSVIYLSYIVPYTLTKDSAILDPVV